MDGQTDEGYTESMLNIILDEIDDIIIIHDSEHTVVWMNRAATERFGTSVEDMIGRRCYSLFGRSKKCDSCTVTSATRDDKSKNIRIVPNTGECYECTTIPLYRGDEIKLVVQHLKRTCD
ncbi:MAG: PAS domain-containing protein [Methanomassiliicoccaceae archaeon]|nr:PAS domain-containing protein [Methanomassiliicoccaceae archaeon]